jgi:hypothetical protein
MRVLSLFTIIIAIVAIMFLASSFIVDARTPLKTYPIPPASCSGPQAGGGGFNCLKERPASISLDTNPPVFVSSVPNGKRYVAGSGNDTFHIAHLYATNESDQYYEMGYALGQMFPNEIKNMFDAIEPWLEQLLENSVPWLPAWLAAIVIKDGAPIALDFVYDLVAKYIPADYYREWQGIAAGANCSIERIKRVSLFPQISKAACTAFSAVDEAAANGGSVQLRCLDFDPTSMVADFSSVIVYHYLNKPALANFGWIAMTGVLTGMNSAGISGGEKKWGQSKKDEPIFGLPIGYPWMQMFRRLLEFDNLDDINAYIPAHTTINNPDSDSVAIHLVFTDGKAPQNNFTAQQVGWEIGYNYSKQYAWNTFTPTPTHPVKPGVILWPKNSNPNTDCVKGMVDAAYGSMDAEWMAMYYSPNDMTGDTQVVGFDVINMKVYFANSRKSGSQGPLCAYYRQRTLLDMNALFASTENQHY